MLKHRFWIEPLVWFLILSCGFSAYYLPDWINAGSSMRFENPLLLLLLLFVPLVLFSGIIAKKTSAKIKFPLAKLAAASGRGIRSWLSPLTVALRALAIVLLIIAVARPQDASRRQETEMDGIDIVMTIDVSGSMRAADLEPTRLEAAKEVVQDFIKRRKNDRIGAVIFAENAYTLCPLTLDYSILTSMIRDIKLGVIEGNATAIGNAVATSINRLRKSDAKSKTIILLTDGTSNAGNVTPEQATLFAKTLGIKIYTILVGQNDLAKSASGVDFFKNTIFGTQSAPVNPELLRQMSEKTGGTFFSATDKKGLFSSFHAILDALERSRIADQGVVYGEAFSSYMWPALFLIALDLLLSLIFFRRTP